MTDARRRFDVRWVLVEARTLGATSLPAAERFFTVVPALYDQVVRGVSFTPGTYHGNS